MIKPTAKQILKWTQALRSGKYKQGDTYLQSAADSYCCLGVACKVFITKNQLSLSGETIYGAFPTQQYHAPQWLQRVNDDFQQKTGRALSVLNDSKKHSFDEIADLLELVYVHKMLD